MKSHASRRVTGVHWDGKGVAVAEIDCSSAVPVVTKWAWGPVDPSAPEKRAGVLKGLFEEYGFAREKIVACLPQSTVLIKVVRFPRASAAETSAMVLLHARKMVPLLAEDIDVEYELIEEGKSDRRLVLIMARASVAEEINSTFSAAGFKLEEIIPESHALLACFGEGRPSGEYLSLIHVGEGRTAFVVSERGKVLLARVVETPDNDGQIFLEWQRIVETLDERAGTGMRILLTGEAATSSSLLTVFRRESGLSVETSDPFSIIGRLGGTSGQLEGESGALLALGAALSANQTGVNFLPRAEKNRRLKSRQARDWFLVAAACLALCLSVGVAVTRRFHEMERRLVVLNARVAALAPEARAAEKMREEIVRARARRDPRNSVLSILSAVSGAAGADVYMNGLDYKKGERVSVHGVARTLAAASSCVEKLSLSEPLQHLTLRSTTSRDVEGERWVDFQAEGDLPADAEREKF